MSDSQPKPKHRFGWIKDEPDERDFIYHPEIDQVAPKDANPVAYFFEWLINLIWPKPKPQPSDNKKVDLRPFDSPIEDQGDLGSCTANAAAGALQFLEIKDGFNDASGAMDFSRLFIYYNERVIEGTVSTDSGAQVRDSAKTLAAQGACYEVTWPYDISQFATAPSAAAVAQGLNHVITSYLKINDGDLASMKACLDAGFPFIFGFTVYSSFEDASSEATGIIPMPSALEPILGGHCIMCLGYDDENQWFICRNSWGASWGDHGYLYMPYAYLSDPNLASDFWTFRRGTNMAPKPSSA